MVIVATRRYPAAGLNLRYMKMLFPSQSDHIEQLAQDLLDDLELNRLRPEHLILKATRLARFFDVPEIREWLTYELKGYTVTPIGIKYMALTGRWTDKEKKLGFWEPLAQIEHRIESAKLELATLRVPDVSYSVSSANPNQVVATGALTFSAPVDTVLRQAAGIRNHLNLLGGIRSKVLGLLHQFVASVYYEVAFSSISESLFESFKREVDALLAAQCGDVLERVPSVTKRLAEGDREAISHALTTCRRILDAFADAVCPPSETPYDVGGGTTLQLDPDKHKNRILAYFYDHCPSASRRHRVRQALSNLYDRVSTGVHSDVTVEEARTLFLETYLLLGEVIVAGNSK